MAEEEGRKERSVPTGVHERAGWSHAGKVTVADPAFFGVSGTVASEEWSSRVLSHGAHIRSTMFSNEVGIGGGSCNGYEYL
jgi:hypothetical protein